MCPPRPVPRAALPLLALLACLAAPGCAVSREQEIALGREARPQFIQQFGGLVPDPGLQRYVDQVGQSLVRQTTRESLPWEFGVLASDQVNAFALPGGFVYITRGMLRQLDSEAQLAAVLAHEVAHVQHRHSVDQLKRMQLIQGGLTLASLFAGEGQAAVAATNIAGLVAGLASMSYGRGQEKEADLTGLKYMARAGYDPSAFLGLIEVLERSGGAGPPEFLSTHPNPGSREQYIRQRLRSRYRDVVSAGREDREEFQRRVSGR